MHEYKFCRNVLYKFIVHVSLLLCPVFLDCILVYEHNNDTNKSLIRKAVLLTTCKRGQKFQIKLCLLMIFRYET